MSIAKTRSQPRIPNQLCERILDCEMELDVDVGPQTLTRITELYSEAMNFYLLHSEYNEENLKWAHYYQDKINKLFSSKQVEECLEDKKVNPKVSQIRKEMDKAKESAPHQAKRLLQFYKNQSSTQKTLICKTMQQQNKRLEERIQMRSKSKSKLSFSSVKTNNILDKKIPNL